MSRFNQSMRNIGTRVGQSPFWNPYRDGVTASLINSFLTCREHTRISYVLGLVPKGPGPDYVSFGTAFHMLVEGRSLRAVRKAVASSGLSGEALETVTGLASIIYSAYKRWWTPHTKDWRWVKKETVFRYPYLVKPYGETIDLRGKIDGVLQRGSREGASSTSVWIHEIKTKGDIDEEAIMGTLHFDIQTMLYALAVQETICPVAGVLYDIVRRPLLRRTKNETVKAFLSRVERDVEERPEHYFKPLEVVLSSKDIERWAKSQLDPILCELLRWFDSLVETPLDRNNPILIDPALSTRHYLNPQAIYGRYGKSPYFEYIINNNRYSVTKRDAVFQELE